MTIELIVLCVRQKISFSACEGISSSNCVDNARPSVYSFNTTPRRNSRLGNLYGCLFFCANGVHRGSS